MSNQEDDSAWRFKVEQREAAKAHEIPRSRVAEINLKAKSGAEPDPRKRNISHRN